MIRALLIEDDNDQIEMYKMAFQLYDMELLWASDGYTGLELAKKSNPHIVICDMLMEVIDGMGT
ncbi:MAG: response regulator, partial [bacterium]